MVKRYMISGDRMWPSEQGNYVASEDYDALAARLAEAERDAARYRALRDKAVNQSDLEAFVALGQLDYATAAQIDAAVDAIVGATHSAAAQETVK